MSDQFNDDLVYINGIDGASGDYLIPSLPVDQVARLAQGEPLDAEYRKYLEDRHSRDTDQDYALMSGYDPEKLDETGWGMIFATDEDDASVSAVQEAMSVLINHRKMKAGERFKIYSGPDEKSGGYRAGESALKFAARHGVDVSQPVNPEKMPYYLLIIGNPERIPYRFQYLLDVQFAVGRIHFDTLDEYEQYAKAVVEAETGKISLARQAAVFGVKTQDDPATQLSSQYLVEKLLPKLSFPGWKVDSYLEALATRENYEAVLNGKNAPALFFSASHGMGFPNGDERQMKHQGALLCQNWPGPLAWKGKIPEEFYFSGETLESTANLSGMIAFLFACYGAGTPRLDDYPHQKQVSAEPIAPHAFISRLPQRMLTRGTLACVGHVERAWTYSFKMKDTDEQIQSFQSTIRSLMAGLPIGNAMEYFNGRFAALSSNLNSELEEIKNNYKTVNERELSSLWTANNDARSYVVIGDPAVHLPLAEQSQAQKRAALPEIKPETTRPVPGSHAASAGETSYSPQKQDAPSGHGQGGRSMSVPYSTPVDGLAFALQLYTGKQEVSFAIGEDGQAFNLIDDARDMVKEIVISLNNALGNLAKKMQEFTSDVATLSITTGFADDLQNIAKESTEARYITRISATGDIQLYVPREVGEADESLMTLHKEMVQQALNNRLELIKAISETVTNLFGSQK